MKKTTILIIEDDPQIRHFLKIGLEANDYQCYEATSGKQGLVELSTRLPDLLILDLGLPDMDGLDLIKQMRAWSHIPVIVLTARDQEQDKVTALDSGADDYLTKPFGLEELLARVRVALRHAQPSANDQAFFTNGPLQIDFVARQVFINKSEVHLTPIEYKMLVLLAKYPGKVITQKQILTDVWGPNSTNQGLHLRVHMHQLRHKIETTPTQPKLIINEPGVGYRMKIIPS